MAMTFDDFSISIEATLLTYDQMKTFINPNNTQLCYRSLNTSMNDYNNAELINPKDIYTSSNPASHSELYERQFVRFDIYCVNTQHINLSNRYINGITAIYRDGAHNFYLQTSKEINEDPQASSNDYFRYLYTSNTDSNNHLINMESNEERLLLKSIIWDFDRFISYYPTRVIEYSASLGGYNEETGTWYTYKNVNNLTTNFTITDFPIVNINLYNNQEKIGETQREPTSLGYTSPISETIQAIPTKPHYKFKCWNTANDGSGTDIYHNGIITNYQMRPYINENNPFGTNTMNLYATWDLATYKINYAIYDNKYKNVPQDGVYTKTAFTDFILPSERPYIFDQGKYYEKRYFLYWHGYFTNYLSGNDNISGECNIPAGGRYTFDADCIFMPIFREDYWEPKLLYSKALRCNSSGVLADDGEYIKITLNIKTYQRLKSVILQYKEKGTSNWNDINIKNSLTINDEDISTWSTKINNDTSGTITAQDMGIDPSDLGNVVETTDVVINNTFLNSIDYNTRIKIIEEITEYDDNTDEYITTEKTVYSDEITVPSLEFAIDVLRGGHGVAIGKSAVNQQELDVAWPIRARGGIISDNNIESVPIGAIQPYAGAYIPQGWLLCNGQAVDRTAYSELFNIIGTIYGDGDGETTFNLPDLRTRVPVGFDISGNSSLFNSLGKIGGSTHKDLRAWIGNIDSNVGRMAYVRESVVPGQRTESQSYAYDGLNMFYSGQASYNHTTRVSDDQGNHPVDITQPYIVINYLIKAKCTQGVMVLGNQYASVVDNCSSISTTDALSAYQGKSLNDKLDGIIGTVLYANASGNTGTVELYDNISNYDYLEIFYIDNVSAQFSTRFIPNGVSQTCNLTVAAIDNGDTLYVKNGQKTISGNTITAYHPNAEANLKNNSHAVYAGSTYIKITRVVGYKLPMVG